MICCCYSGKEKEEKLWKDFRKSAVEDLEAGVRQKQRNSRKRSRKKEDMENVYRDALLADKQKKNKIQ